MLWRTAGAFLLAASLALACSSQDTTTEPDTTPPEVPGFEIEDGAHGGNAHFFFLPPLVPAPSYSGSSDNSLLPALAVEVCDLGTSRPRATQSCGTRPALVARFTSTTGTGSEVLRYDAAAQQYIVNWHTDKSNGGTLQTTHYYRLRVLAAGTVLGQADIDPVRSASDLKNYDTGNSIPLVNGRTLPVKFRVEAGAVFVAGPSATARSFTAPSTVAGNPVVLTLAPNTTLNGTAGTSVGLTVTPITSPAGRGAASGTAYEFGPNGTTFSPAVTLTLPYAQATLAGIPEASLRLYSLTAEGKLAFVPGSSVDLTRHTVTGQTSHFSVYVAAQQARIDIVQSSATVAVGSMVELDATIDQPGREVSWTSSDPASATVDANGVVTGVAPGTATITASVDGQSDQAIVTVTNPGGGFNLAYTDLGQFDANANMQPQSLSPEGVISGLYDNGDEQNAFVYTPAAGLLTLSGIGAAAYDANDREAVGTSNQAERQHAVRWSTSTRAVLHDLGQGEARAINSQGYVVGLAQDENTFAVRAVLWGPTDAELETLPSIIANGRVVPVDINDALQVVGSAAATAPAGFTTDHAFLWTEAGSIRDLTPSLRYSLATGINATGQVVGTYGKDNFRDGAFTWSETTGLELLPDLVTGGYCDAAGINDRGEILGRCLDQTAANRTTVIWTRRDGAWAVMPLDLARPNPYAVAINDDRIIGVTVGERTQRLALWTIRR